MALRTLSSKIQPLRNHIEGKFTVGIEGNDQCEGAIKPQEYSPNLSHLFILNLVDPIPHWGQMVTRQQIDNPGRSFLAIVANTGIETVRSLWRLGIQGIVHRDDLEWEFTHAVEAVGNRQHYLSFTLIQNTPMPTKQQPRTAKRSDLSLRESQVLRLLARDLSNAQIADALDLSIRSVERLRTTLRQKLGFKHLHTGLMWAAKMKWV